MKPFDFILLMIAGLFWLLLHIPVDNVHHLHNLGIGGDNSSIDCKTSQGWVRLDTEW